MTTTRATLTPCSTCRRGCECDGQRGDLDCGHYACWGRDRDKAGAEPLERCAGVAYERARTAAITAAQDTLHFARRRGPEVYGRVRDSVLAAAGLAATDD